MKGNILDISNVDFLFMWKIIRAEQCGNSRDGNERLSYYGSDNMHLAHFNTIRRRRRRR
jgi:hypothetical protein